MQALAESPGVTVIATYTKRPPITWKKSSAVCQYPVSLPCLDIDATTQATKELRLPFSQDSLDANQKRMWATLCFRLGVTLTESGLMNLHRPNKFAKELFKKFGSAANDTDITEALKKCNVLCEFKPCPKIDNPNAAKLLLGVPEMNIDRSQTLLS